MGQAMFLLVMLGQSALAANATQPHFLLLGANATRCWRNGVSLDKEFSRDQARTVLGRPPLASLLPTADECALPSTSGSATNEQLVNNLMNHARRALECVPGEACSRLTPRGRLHAMHHAMHAAAHSTLRYYIHAEDLEHSGGESDYLRTLSRRLPFHPAAVCDWAVANDDVNIGASTRDKLGSLLGRPTVFHDATCGYLRPLLQLTAAIAAQGETVNMRCACLGCRI
jgi:hypothetical protein